MTIDETLEYLRGLGFANSMRGLEIIEKQIGPYSLRASPDWLLGRVQINGSFRSAYKVADTEGMLTDSVFSMLMNPAGLLPQAPTVEDVHKRIEAIFDELPEPEPFTQLCRAISDNKFDEVDELLQKWRISPDQQFKPYRGSMLHHARTPEMVRKLIAFGVSPNQPDNRGRTPLHEAATLELIDALVDGGAAPDALDHEGRSALHRPLAPEIIDRLIKAGTPVGHQDRAGNTALHLQHERLSLVALVKAGTPINLENERGETALAMYLERDDIVKVTALLILGADPNYRNRDGRTAVFSVRSLPMFTVLVGNFDAEVQVVDSQGRTPLFGIQKAALVAEMLRHRVPAAHRDNDGMTALHAAAAIEVVRLLLQAGADVGARDNRGRAPLHAAAAAARHHAVRALIDAGADPGAVDTDGNTPLHCAATDHIAEVLVRAGADANAKNCAGVVPNRTPLANLFCTSGKEGSGRAFDGDTYVKAKPHFEALMADFAREGQDILELIRELTTQFGAGIKPYLLQFAQDLRTGGIEADGAAASLRQSGGGG